MEPTFRASMNWLHTWAGVVVGAVLFAVFWMGSLSVFDREIDRWMAPMTRLVAEDTISLDMLRPSLAEAAAAGSPFWTVILPTQRDPAVRIFYQENGEGRERALDPMTGAVLRNSGTWAGTGFLYPFHYSLRIFSGQIGIWLVGLAAMTMLSLCISGVVIHRKILTDFFTFRPRTKSGRMLLDLHTVVGVLGLPFYIAITLSGLVIFGTAYFPSGWQSVYKGNFTAYAVDTFGGYDRAASGKQATSAAPLDDLMAEARQIWGGARPSTVQVRHPGDAAAFVIIGRPSTDRVALISDALWFDAATGRLLHQFTAPRPVMTAQSFISGLHIIQFRHWTLRWLYFVMGLTGCILIATGYLFWLDSRRKRHAQLGLAGVRVVTGLTIGSVTGIINATLAFFVVNRLLPLGITFAGAERAALEIWTFYLVWLATFAHAWMRPGRAWAEQCRVIAVLAGTAVLLNWITTGDHLIRSLGHRHLWPIAGMDLLLIAGAGIAALAAHRLNRRAAEPPARHMRPAKPVAQAAE